MACCVRGATAGSVGHPHLEAHASVPHLSHLMRHVFTHPDEAAAKAQVARRTMLSYARDRVGAFVHYQLKRITYERTHGVVPELRKKSFPLA